MQLELVRFSEKSESPALAKVARFARVLDHLDNFAKTITRNTVNLTPRQKTFEKPGTARM